LAADCVCLGVLHRQRAARAEAEIRQEFNLNADQAQRYIQRTSDVMKELKYIAGNRLTAGNGSAGQNGEMAVPDFEPLFPIPTARDEHHLA
jgi:hypothetical protein